MKNTGSQFRCLMLGVVALLAVAAVKPALAQRPEGGEKTLSPYFMVKSDDSTTDALPLLSTAAAVDIAGVIADVRVTQVYKNSGRKPIEAVYIFPASTRAAVYAMKMTIGTRTITAQIQEREQARQNYNQAVENGQSASLLEQQRPNVFQMNVGNIMPGDTIKVEMNYTELLVPTDGVYEFVYPTVVGPRYSNRAAAESDPDDRWTQNPYTHQGEAPLYSFDINVNLNAGMPISEVNCSSHKTRIGYRSQAQAAIGLDPSEKDGGNRDFILKYRLTGDAVQTGLLLCQRSGENFFLAMVQPPRRVGQSQIPPREYIFIMDVSGSMYGYPIDISKQLLKDLIGSLRPSDYFNVLLFAGGNSVLSEQSLAATRENVDRALTMIDNQQGGGGTELLPALKRALALPRAEGTSRTVVVATDGYVDVEPEAFDLVRDNLGEANMFAFGIGTSVNRLLIEGLAHVGMGEPFVVEDQEHAPAAAARFRVYVQTPVLTGVKVRFDGFEAYDFEPKNVPDVLAERPVIVFGKWRGHGTGTITVSGTGAAGGFRRVLNVGEHRPAAANGALRYLWARQRVQLLSDYAGAGRVDSAQVTQLGLKYSLLTQYTSFVAIDKRVRNQDGRPEVVRQPLPLPQGVSDYAVGGATGRAGAGYGGLGSACKSLAAAAPCEGAFEDFDEPSVSPAVHVSLAEVKPGKGLSEVEVRRALEAVLGQVEQEYLGTGPARGSLTIRFTVGADGTVSRLATVKNQLEPGFDVKVRNLVSGLAFANPTGGDVSVTVRFEFTP